MNVSVYGAEWCGFCHRLMDWLRNKDVEFTYINVDEPGKREEMNARTNGNQTIPVLFVGDQFWVHPQAATLNALFVDKTGAEGTRDAMLETKEDESTEVKTVNQQENDMNDTPTNQATEHEAIESATTEPIDCLMIGAGPTSLAAAVYTAREDIQTVIYEKAIIGGMAAITDRVDNYPGFPEGIEGLKLAEQLEAQTKRFGATIELDEVTAVSKREDGLFDVGLSSGTVRAKTILIGTGSQWKKLGIPGEEEFYGRGVHNCATCDGAFYRDKRLVVVGGGNSSAQEALFLTKFASHIDILVRGDSWKASEVLVEDIEKNDKITVHFNTTTDEIVGQDGKVTKVVGGTPDGPKDFETDGVFVFIGLKPVTHFLEGSGVGMDDYGFVKTDEKLMTAVPGLFCAGDVRSGATMQIASAVGEGATAALSIREYLENLARQ